MTRWAEDCTGPEWSSLLNKRSLLHEMEEVIIPLHHLLEFLSQTDCKDPILVDLCAGKGYFAFCVAELAKTVPLLQKLKSVIVLDHSKIDWTHFDLRRQEEADGTLLSVVLWDSVDLHSHTLPAKFAALPGGLLLNGTHLCRRLSSRAVELFNVLPNSQLLILAPCCVPYKKQAPPMFILQRSREIAERYSQGCECPFDARGNRSRKKCSTCWSSDDCWKCGERGHAKVDCPGRVARPPCETAIVDVEGVWATETPFSSWVDALCKSVSSPCRRIDAELRSEARKGHDIAVAAANPQNKTLGRRMSWLIAEQTISH
eukprot:TRINITY_DN29430_c0_g1_i2.p1 TRINITY_DN29430_c0_g1~~TRINITY_DN29430_c0_g1_i2.p1  ORF type:complete len:316 (-),score=38.12 TRINITY_DN29430_c0_g1_i2:402-1349(-)